ncbi:MAG: hypothetical protein ACE5KK_05665 [Candidatus Brocadiales bacterium]
MSAPNSFSETLRTRGRQAKTIWPLYFQSVSIHLQKQRTVIPVQTLKRAILPLFILLGSLTIVCIANAQPATFVNSGEKEVTEEKQKIKEDKEKIKKGKERPVYKEGELLMKFKEGVTSEEIASVLSRLQLEIIREFDEIDVYHVKIKDGTSVQQKITELMELEAVKYAEPVYIVAPP